MEKGRFFNAVDNDRLYDADDINAIIAAIATTGINGDGFAVTPLSGLTVSLAPGEAVIEGHLYTLDEPKNLTCDAAHATNPRIDAVVIRLDNDARTITSQIVKGTPAASPVAPSPVRTGTIYDLVVAHIYIPAGAASITAGNITDTRYDNNLCGEAQLKPTAQVSKTAIEAVLTGNITSHEHTRYLDKGDGVQALRLKDGALEVFNGYNWIKIETEAGGVPPLDVKDLSITEDYGKLTIKWRDPDDLVLNGTVVSKWAGTKLVRKAGSYPKKPSDGVILLDSTVKDAYAENGFVDSGLTTGETYYYQLFPYSSTGAVNMNETNRVSGTPGAYKIYGVQIDLTNTNPETSCTYTDDAVGMTPGTAWDDTALFRQIRPCVLKDGVVQYYLDPNDFTKKADGTSADITSGADGDVMIEIPKTGFKITTSGNTLTIKVTDNPNDTANFKYYAHTRSAEGDRSKLYIGAYLGWNDGGKLRSLSGKTPTANQTIGTFRTQAQANGNGYDLVSFYPLTLLQCLYLIKYKNLDSQTALGRGYVDENSAATNTGGTNQKGMFFGETTGKQQMKFLGIEDFWGNLRWWIDGLYSDENYHILTAFQNFNDTGSGYTDRGQGATYDISGYMSKPKGTSEAGFIAKEVSGSSTTHFADYASLDDSRLPYFGGYWKDASDAGAFFLGVNRYKSDSYSSIGARLMYL